MKTEKEEIWKDIKGFEGVYQVSNLGRVKSLPRYTVQKHWVEEKILNTHHNNSGYCDISLYQNTKRVHKKVHRLVAEAFLPNPYNLPEVDHIDTNKDNNCVWNLKWCTHSENHMNPLSRKHRSEILTGRHLSQEQIDKQSTPIDVFLNGDLLYTFRSYKELDMYSKDIIGVKLWNVYVRQVIKGKRKTYKGFTFAEHRKGVE